MSVETRTRLPTTTATNEMGLGPKRTLFVFVVVVGCFAVLWPKVFYPMLVGSAQQQMQPSEIDKKTGCCDVISDTDVDTIKILTQICGDITQHTDSKPLTGKAAITNCKNEILKTCGIDISAVLQEQVRLGYTVKQILNEIRSLNGSLCLKYNFGVPPWSLGVPHRVIIKDDRSVKQERSANVQPEMMHPAFRERGRAIPHPNLSPVKTTTTRRVVDGRPGPVPGMRPPMGGAGQVVPPSQKATGTMGIVMPLYTIGIVIFFTYTLMKVLFKKQPDGVGGGLYPSVQSDGNFRRDVFESQKCQKYWRDNRSSKLVVNAMSALLDEVDKELESRTKVFESEQDSTTLVNGNLTRKPTEAIPEETSVTVLGMETTASCEGGQKWSRPDSPLIPLATSAPQEDPSPPQAIYLEGTFPAQSQLLVAESAAEPQRNESVEADPAVVLAGKMTLSVVSMGSSQDDVEHQEKIEENGLDTQDESKYTTVSGNTDAENEVMDDEEGATSEEEIEDDIPNNATEQINQNTTDLNEIIDQLIAKHEQETESGEENRKEATEEAEKILDDVLKTSEDILNSTENSKLNGHKEPLNSDDLDDAAKEDEDEYEYEIEEIEVDDDYEGDDEIIDEVVEVDRKEK